MTYKLNFRTQYNQFYIADKESPMKTDEASFWTTEAYDDRLAIGDGILGVGIESYGPVNGELTLLNTRNNSFDFSKFDHIVEAGINIKSGHLEVLDCPNSGVHLEVKINPGHYRVRVYSANLASVNGDKGDDFYHIEIWPDKNPERKVLKRYISK
ncbi:hypothetical protein [Mucilaginibacter sp. L3T2-6]|uniref:hypothetical protein n=1 Tax=Mucilaginibacter sp. L3T2-6 TaxID=3062491 RepID=UPI002674A8D0|nr:hypothetical protein [Mucilaginibacter sp. L3T2-6]MDO3645016.1 hypothetical protein [Mucilaginibacter sp. L3T2-6]MDV6217467.1 hypothetical protein [Mucilaginibacter sp. L3T2-6]